MHYFLGVKVFYIAYFTTKIFYNIDDAKPITKPMFSGKLPNKTNGVLLSNIDATI